MSEELPHHVTENRRHWDEIAHHWVEQGERAWDVDEPAWGCWGVSNEEIPLLPHSLHGVDAIELGCGTGYVSRWMELRGAGRVLGIDNSEAQLATARRMAEEHGSGIELVHGNAEEVPEPSASFDFAISEYGAAVWCDPGLWVPEAHRLLRPGGHLVFLGNHPLALCCSPEDGAAVDRRLHRPWFDMLELDWSAVPVDPGGIEFNLGVAGWMALFREVGFAVEDYREVQAPEGPAEVRFFASREWARSWPSEHAWWLQRL